MAFLRLLVRAHFHEREPAGAPRSHIAHHFNRFDGSRAREQLLELRFSRFVREVSDIERISKVADVDLVLSRPTWYGRVTGSEAVMPGPTTDRRRVLEADRASLTEAAPSPVQGDGTAPHPRSRRSHRDSVRP